MSADPSNDAPPPMTDALTARTAAEWRREHDRQSPLKRDRHAERLALIRESIIEALEPGASDLYSCLLSLDNRDDVGAAYHFRRVIVAVKAAAQGFRELTPAQAQKADAA
jgi:hypothetical protein